MNTNVSQSFSALSAELCNLIYVKEYKKDEVNYLLDELNSKPLKSDIFVNKQDASSLVTGLCLNIKPTDEILAAKTSHLLNSIITRQNIQFSSDSLSKVIKWHTLCLKQCSDINLPDILHSLQCILHCNQLASAKFADDLIGYPGILTKLIEDNETTSNTINKQQVTLLCLKCMCSVTSIPEDKNVDSSTSLTAEIKDKVGKVVLGYLYKGFGKNEDEYLNCKAIIAALRVLSQIYFNGHNNIPLPDVIGICKYYIFYGLVSLGSKPERVMPSHQVIAPTPVPQNTKGGKKQKLRKQRNSAIESLKKDKPVSDKSLMRDVVNFESPSAYAPVTHNYLDPQIVRPKTWALTSDSDLSDVDSGREAKMVALRSRVRQSASNLLLVIVKVTEKRDMFGYWWSLLPDAPGGAAGGAGGAAGVAAGAGGPGVAGGWASEPAARRTLLYAAVTDPVAGARAAVLSAVLALLAGSRGFLLQAESCKKETSFTPFSVTLGHMVACAHHALAQLLDRERAPAVCLLALKCCGALVQATPYHKMEAGLVGELVRAARKFLVHRDVTLQVGALIMMGCVLSIDPKVDEVLKSIQKDAIVNKSPALKEDSSASDVCDDFEEGYSDDEMFTASEEKPVEDCASLSFKSWILDICFRNLGWINRGGKMERVAPATIPVVLESLAVLSAAAHHHWCALLAAHVGALGAALHGALRHERADVAAQAARCVSVLGDALQRLEQTNEAPPLNQCVQMWELLLKPLAVMLQSEDSGVGKALACDCIANIGERCFKELPRSSQLLCCALLMGSCGDEEAATRAAAVRALAMFAAYRTLREDIGFVSDCGEHVLRALREPAAVLRGKAAWALASLSDALVQNMEDPELEDLDDGLLTRLLAAGVTCAADSDKVKMSATRSLGNLLRLITDAHIQRNAELRPLCEAAVEKLLDCAGKVANMKVRWNACYALGSAMKNDHLFSCFSGWQRQVFARLCALSQDCKNLKVRITAAAALRAPRSRALYGEHYAGVWRGLLAAVESAANVDDFSEYRHKDNLIEQLSVTLAHLCCQLQQSDLADIVDPLTFHFDSARGLSTRLCHRLPPENPSCLRILEAANYVTVELTGNTDAQQQALRMLQEIFIWDL